MEYLILFNIIIILTRINAMRRIVGGRDSKLGEFPYVASFGITFGDAASYVSSYQHICTCSILSPSWSISAGHCIEQSGTAMIRHSSHLPTHLGNFSKVLEMIIHPGYEDNDGIEFMLKNDICLLRSEPIKISKYMALSAVDYTTLIGHEALILGHGVTNGSKELDVAINVGKPLQVMEGLLHRCLENDSMMPTRICVVAKCGVASVITGGDSGGPVIHKSGLIGVNSMCEIEAEDKGTFKKLDRYSLALSSASIVATISPSLDWISSIIASRPRDIYA